MALTYSRGKFWPSNESCLLPSNQEAIRVRGEILVSAVCCNADFIVGFFCPKIYPSKLVFFSASGEIFSKILAGVKIAFLPSFMPSIYAGIPPNTNLDLNTVTLTNIRRR